MSDHAAYMEGLRSELAERERLPHRRFHDVRRRFDMEHDVPESPELTARGVWEDADTDPKLVRSYHHPVDGWYFLGSDIVAWLRDLAETARGGTLGVLHAPLMDRMAETVERWLSDSAAEEDATDG